MCDAGQTPGISAGPRWGCLYAILPLAVGAFLLVEAYVPAPGVRAVLRYVLAGGAWGAIVWWVQANRTALDQLEWCACAARALRVRVVTSEPADSRRRWAPETLEPVAVAVGGLPCVADEPAEVLAGQPLAAAHSFF